MSDQKKNIAIIGFGRFGKLLAELLKPFGNIYVVSGHKIEDDWQQIEYNELGRIDWVFLCVPISAMESTIEKMKNYLRPGCLVLDVCSVKEYPCKLMNELLPDHIEIIGTHPMFGPDSAKNGLEGLQMVFCLVRSSTEILSEVKEIFGSLKLKIIETTAENHDRQAAKSLALVHFIGRALGQTGIGEQEIMTKGFERLLAVCETVNNDTWQLFLDMQNYNQYTEKTRLEFVDSLQKIEKEIKQVGGQHG